MDIMDLQFLNELKKEDKGLRREQNKRYREKYREILNLKRSPNLNLLLFVHGVEKLVQCPIIMKIVDILTYFKAFIQVHL